MRWPPLLIILSVAALADGFLWLSRPATTRGNLSLIERPLLETDIVERAARIVITEKPQSRILYSDGDGSEIRLEAAPDARPRQTSLWKDASGTWRVADCLDLPADRLWLGQTLRDLEEGSVVRELTTNAAEEKPMGFGAAQIDFVDRRGVLIRRLEFGRKDGTDYQFARIDGGVACIAKQTAEIVGEPMSWINARPIDADPDEVREFRMEFPDGETPLTIQRSSRAEAFRSLDASAASIKWAAKWLKTFAGAPALGVVGIDSQRSRPGRPLGTVHLAFFDGSTLEFRFSGLAPGSPQVAGTRPESLVIAGMNDSRADSLVSIYGRRARFVYSRGTTATLLPSNRASLAHLISLIP